jgi:hypothetical protein
VSGLGVSNFTPEAATFANISTTRQQLVFPGYDR